MSRHSSRPLLTGTSGTFILLSTISLSGSGKMVK